MKLIYLLLASSLVLTACGGGGGSSGGVEAPNPATAGNTTESPVADLPGLIYYESWGTSLAAYDPETEREQTIVANAQKDITFVSQDGQWVGWASGTMGEDISIKNRWDDTLSYVIQLGTINNRVKAPPSFSPNGKNVLVLSKGDFFGDIEVLSVRNRNGTVLELPYKKVKDITDTFFDDWGWLNDNAILITSGAYFFVIRDIYNPSLEIIQQYESYKYAPVYLTLSPDGSKLAYTRNSNIYVHDLQTNNEIALTHDSNVRSISWSPDGKYFAFVTGRYIGGCDPGSGHTPTLHVMPTDLSETVRVVHGEQPSSNQVRTLKWHTRQGYENVCVFGNQTYWTPRQ